MSGETDLSNLLAQLSPELDPETYVFCTFKNAQYGDIQGAKPLAAFMEKEGLTLVVQQHRADHLGLDYSGVFSCITLMVHSSLDAIGLTAAVSSVLAKNQISANVIAAYHHDHVFVPENKAAQALALLQKITE